MKKILLAMMVAGTLFSAEAKSKAIPNKTRLDAVKKTDNAEIKKLYKKASEASKLYKKESDKKKKAELKAEINKMRKEIDTQLSAADPKYKALVDKINAENAKAKKKK